MRYLSESQRVNPYGLSQYRIGSISINNKVC